MQVSKNDTKQAGKPTEEIIIPDTGNEIFAFLTNFRAKKRSETDSKTQMTWMIKRKGSAELQNSQERC
jgi:hypothetical protein